MEVKLHTETMHGTLTRCRDACEDTTAVRKWPNKILWRDGDGHGHRTREPSQKGRETRQGFHNSPSFELSVSATRTDPGNTRATRRSTRSGRPRVDKSLAMRPGRIRRSPSHRTHQIPLSFPFHIWLVNPLRPTKKYSYSKVTPIYFYLVQDIVTKKCELRK